MDAVEIAVIVTNAAEESFPRLVREFSKKDWKPTIATHAGKKRIEVRSDAWTLHPSHQDIHSGIALFRAQAALCMLQVRSVLTDVALRPADLAEIKISTSTKVLDAFAA